MNKVLVILMMVIIFIVLIGCESTGKTNEKPVIDYEIAGTGSFFDDFNYSGPVDEVLEANGWTVRTDSGGPGVTGAKWKKDAVSFLPDPDDEGNVIMQLKAKNNGKKAFQAEIFQKRKFFEGTYATRIRFTDSPIYGPDDDEVVQTFFSITPLDAPMDPAYSEIDFEYLPNGGWGKHEPTLFTTTWETYNPDPWEMDADSKTRGGSVDGWHTLVFTVMDGNVTYYFDGKKITEHGDKYYPEQIMSINYNLWFINHGLVVDDEERAYIEEIDWVYYEGKIVLTPEQVLANISRFREDGQHFLDTVPPLF